MTLRSKNKLDLSQEVSLEAREMLVKTEGFPVSGVSENQVATLSVDLDSKRDSNDRLFGVNLGWHLPTYGAGRGLPQTDTFRNGYDGEEAQSLVRRWRPPEIRWGDGLWANFYDWETDRRSRGVNYPENGTYFGAAGSAVEYGIDGFANLQQDLGFDALFTWNINQDAPEDGVRRLRDHRSKELGIDRIELGNELFFSDQRGDSTRLTREEVVEIFLAQKGPREERRAAAIAMIDREESRLIVDQARAHYAALKAEDPSLEISVPVSYRFTGDDVRSRSIIYNEALAENQDFFDAVSLHRYVRNNEQDAGGGSTGPTVTNEDVLDSRRTILNSARDVRRQFPGKDIWLTEFAVRTNERSEMGDNALSALALADSYLGFIDNPDLIASAEYFQANGGTPLINFTRTADGQFDHNRTTLGVTYDSLREVFVGSEVLNSSVNSTDIKGTLDSVSAEVAEKDGEVLVYVVNKSPFEADFNLEFNNVAFNGQYDFQTLEFENVDDSLTLENDANRLNLEAPAFANASQQTGSTVKLPGLSMSLISIDRADL